MGCVGIGIPEEVRPDARGPGVIVAGLMDKVFDHDVL